MVSDSIQLSYLFEVGGTSEAAGVCMQELVLSRRRTFVCSCSTDSPQLFFGRCYQPSRVMKRMVYIDQMRVGTCSYGT